MQTRDQIYAATIYEQVSTVVKQPEYKQYGAIAHKLPILIRTAGLVQALSFVEARSKKEIQKRLLTDLKATIEPNDPRTLLVHAQQADLSEYMRLTQQVMAALLWYKRFAQSILGVDASEEALENGSEQ
jgi:CRISPR-associated protein Cmr5